MAFGIIAGALGIVGAIKGARDAKRQRNDHRKSARIAAKSEADAKLLERHSRQVAEREFVSQRQQHQGGKYGGGATAAFGGGYRRQLFGSYKKRKM